MKEPLVTDDEPRPVAICATCGQAATKIADVVVTPLRIDHITCVRITAQAA